MSTLATPPTLSMQSVRCYYRPAILLAAAALLLGSFWFLSRYPQLIIKSSHLADTLPSMAYGGALVPVDPEAPAWERVLATMGNWLNSMKIGMGFGVLLGALLHTALQFYPLKLGGNRYWNSIRGAIIGVPAGVCANCSVPVACGVTRGNGRVEAALGFLFSSPNFNPVVVVMTIAALPLALVITKYIMLVLVIAAAVPLLVRWADRAAKPLPTAGDLDISVCAIDLRPLCSQSFLQVLGHVGGIYLRHLWNLLRPTLLIMLGASFAASLALVFVPWNEVLADTSPGMMALVSLLATAMPVPIALDVMFAGNLQAQGVSGGYVAMFALGLGTYSMIPSIYLWREVSRRLAIALFLLFWAISFLGGLIFS